MIDRLKALREKWIGELEEPGAFSILPDMRLQKIKAIERLSKLIRDEEKDEQAVVGHVGFQMRDEEIEGLS